MSLTAPPQFLFLNDGRQPSQLLCKVCGRLSQLAARHRLTRPGRNWCLYCPSALYRWKQRPDCTLYKCPRDRDPHYLQKQHALKWNEKLLQKPRLSQFKLPYQYREYRFQPAQLAPFAPHRLSVDLTCVHRSSDLLGLVLAFRISFALSARKTAQLLRQVYGALLRYPCYSCPKVLPPVARLFLTALS
jgi:hypothetical protein